MLSVNTNSGAMVALQNLNQTNSKLMKTQNAINTGLSVSSAKDNGAVFAIAQNMRGDVAGYTSVQDSLSRGISSVDVALSAGQSISDLLIEMKQKALSAADASLDTASRQALNEDFKALRDQISSVVSNAVFNGYNLVDGSTTKITALASADGSRRITVNAEKMSLSGTIVTLKSTGTISTAAKASTMVATHRFLVAERQRGPGPSGFGCEEVLDPGRLRPETVRHADIRHRQPGRRRHGETKRAAPVAAGQAAARRSGARRSPIRRRRSRSRSSGKQLRGGHPQKGPAADFLAEEREPVFRPRPRRHGVNAVGCVQQ